MNNPIRNWRRQKKIHQFRNRIGTVETWTEIIAPPAQFAGEAPYVVALVRMDDGGFQYGMITDINSEDIVKGMKVRATVRVVSTGAAAEDIITYGLKFVPVDPV
ncbi:MAG: OB-fold domain-containing protein [Patescibacteria group bacterium]|nr:OB-fold domain-containing protein [Patescibacteria group bacterium]